MPEEPKATASATINGMSGWILQVANLTAVGALIAFLFWSHDQSTRQMNHFNDNANEFHRDIYKSMGEQQALNAGRDAVLVDVQHRLDEANKKLTWLEWMQSGGRLPLVGELYPNKVKQ